MLYDPKWEVETRADPFSLDSLIAWLEKQPATVTYCYVDCGRCLLSQYFTAMGFEDVKISPFFVQHSGGCSALPDQFDRIAVGPHQWLPRDLSKAHGWTFGKALERAREAAGSK